MILVSEVALFCNPVDLQILQQFASLDTYTCIYYTFQFASKRGFFFFSWCLVDTPWYLLKYGPGNPFSSVDLRLIISSRKWMPLSPLSPFTSLIFPFSPWMCFCNLHSSSTTYLCVYCFEKSAKTSFYSFLFSSLFAALLQPCGFNLMIETLLRVH